MEPARISDDRRKVGFWLGLCASMVIVLGVTAVVLWCWLPIWAPLFVIRNSPWVVPLLRAETRVRGHSSSLFGPTDFDEHMVKWGATAVPGLLWALGHEDLPVRLLTMHYLESLADARCVEPLIAVLKDPDPGMRGSAVTILGNLGDARAIVPLFGLLARESMSDFPGAFHALIRLPIDQRQHARLLAAGVDALRQSDVDLDGAAAECLGALGDQAAVPPLLALIQELMEPRKYGVFSQLNDRLAEGLDALGDPRASLTIIHYAGPEIPDQDSTRERDIGDNDTSPRQLWDYTRTRAWCANPIAVPLLSFMAMVDRERVRRDFAIKLLAEHLDVPATSALIFALGDCDSRVRQDAFNALKPRHLRPDQVEHSGTVLITALARPDPVCRQFAAAALAVFRDPRAVPPLIQVLRDPVMGVKLTAIETLTGSGDPRAVDPLLPLLAYPDLRVVRETLTALGELPLGPRQRASAADRMLAMLAAPDPAENIYAVQAAGSIRDPRLVPALMDGLEATPVRLSRAVIVALGFQGDARATDLLIAVARDPDSDLRWDAIAALAAIGDPRAIPTLIEILGDRDNELHAAANTALTRFKLDEGQRHAVEAARANREKNR